MNCMEQALAGFRVLDFGHYIPGPYAAMLLADQGADVIKVERPGGDPYRKEPGFMVLNRSKRGIILDLKKAGGQHIAQELAKHADVIIENFSPGVADRLGIGFDTIHRINPRAVYLSISGFGRKGPYRDRPGWDAIVGSTAGVYVTQAGGEEFQPLYLVLPLPSYYAAFMSAFSVTMALITRETTGKGQRIDISLLSSIMAAGSYFLLDFEEKIRVPGAVNPQGGQPIYKLYHGSDDKWFFLGCGNLAFFTKFALLMEHDEWLIDPRFEGAPFLVMPPHNEELAAELQKIFSTKTRDEWLDFLRAEDIPCAPADPVTKYIDDPQIKANSMVIELEEPDFGIVRQMGIPIKLSENPGSVKSRSPMLGEHTGMVLSDLLGLSTEEITRMKDQKII